MAHDVFISYSNKDKTTADAVCHNLEENGIRCWIASRDALPGINYGKSIIRAIKESKVLVLILSSNSNQSDYVMKELERAVKNGTTIIPFRVENVDPSESIEYFIAGANWLDALTPPLEAHINSLTQKIGVLLNNTEPQTLDIPNKNILSDLSLSPLITITAGIIIYGVFAFIFKYGGMAIGLLICGFIATYFAKEKKLRYGYYGGIVASMITLGIFLLGDISKYLVKSTNVLADELLILVIIIILSAIIGIIAIIGSFIGKKTSRYITKKQKATVIT